MIFQKNIDSPLGRSMNRGKKELELDMKSAENLKHVRQLCLNADVLLDPYRPGVLESIGLDPIDLLKVRLEIYLE